MSFRRLSQEEIQVIIDDYPNFTNPELAIKYGVKVPWLQLLRKKNNLHKTNYSLTDLPDGYKCNNLTVLYKTDKKQKNNIMYKCECSCGKQFLVRSTILKCGKISCCLKCGETKNIGETHQNRGGLGPIGGMVWTRLRRNAKQRGIEFNLTLEYIVNLYEKQNRKCALTGFDIYFPFKFSDIYSGNASLDRIDNSKPYEIGNVRWVDKRINTMKHIQNDEEFLKLCTAVVEYNKNNQDKII